MFIELTTEYNGKTIVCLGDIKSIHERLKGVEITFFGEDSAVRYLESYARLEAKLSSINYMQSFLEVSHKGLSSAYKLRNIKSLVEAGDFACDVYCYEGEDYLTLKTAYDEILKQLVAKSRMI